jgi:hypothetical protein
MQNTERGKRWDDVDRMIPIVQQRVCDNSKQRSDVISSLTTRQRKMLGETLNFTDFQICTWC